MIHAESSAHAGANSVFFPGLDFLNDMRIGNVRAGHADHIDDTLADRMACGRRIDDAAGMERRQLEFPSEFLHQAKVGRRRRRHAGHQVDVINFRVDAAVVEIEKVDKAGSLV